MLSASHLSIRLRYRFVAYRSIFGLRKLVKTGGMSLSVGRLPAKLLVWSHSCAWIISNWCFVLSFMAIVSDGRFVD